MDLDVTARRRYSFIPKEYTESLVVNASSKGGLEILCKYYALSEQSFFTVFAVQRIVNAWMRLHQLARPIAAVLSRCLVSVWSELRECMNAFEIHS